VRSVSDRCAVVLVMDADLRDCVRWRSFHPWVSPFGIRSCFECQVGLVSRANRFDGRQFATLQ